MYIYIYIYICVCVWVCVLSESHVPHGCWLCLGWESLMVIAQECCELYWTSPGGSIQQSSSSTDTYHPSQKPSKLDEQDMWNTAGEVRADSKAIYSYGHPNTEKQG